MIKNFRLWTKKNMYAKFVIGYMTLQSAIPKTVSLPAHDFSTIYI